MQNLNTTISSLFFARSSNWQLQLFRYVFVGGFAFVVDYSLLYILTEFFGIYYLLSATISFIAGLLVNYLLSIRWVFKDSKYENRTIEFTIFAVIGVIGLLFNAFLMWLATDVIHFYYMVSKLLVAAIIMLWNFFCRKLILFNKKTK